jgi:hypothetical protein
VFKEITLRVYGEGLAGPVPEFPAQMEQSINNYLKSESVEGASPPEGGQNRINLSRHF